MIFMKKNNSNFLSFFFKDRLIIIMQNDLGDIFILKLKSNTN